MSDYPDELANLREIVARLPHTRDGVPKHIDDKVWFLGFRAGKCRAEPLPAYVKFLPKHGLGPYVAVAHTNCGEQHLHVGSCFSSMESAEASRTT